MENKFQTIKAEPDSQYCLRPCGNCKSSDVIYIKADSGGKQEFRVRCRSCGQRTPWWKCQHDAQVDWNSRGIYEKNGDKNHRIILNNDNDDRRLLFENCRLKAKRVVNPIIDWQDSDVWGFLEDAKIPVNPLYGEGWCRVGCVGCPMAGKKGREMEFTRWPKYKNLYLLAFKNLLAERAARGKIVNWQTSQDVFNWWMEYDILPGQMDLFGEAEEWEET